MMPVAVHFLPYVLVGLNELLCCSYFHLFGINIVAIQLISTIWYLFPWLAEMGKQFV